jgi:prepilin-type N-terminal cleavage/methylation domain-containing protein
MKITNIKGFTFLEMVVVVVIIGILSTVAMRAIDRTLDRGRFESTVKEMDQLVHSMVGDPGLYSGSARTDFGYFGDIGSLPPDLDALVANPGYGTWDGPYMSRDFTQDAEGFKFDAWGDSYDYGGVTITSSGGGNQITRRIANALSDLTSNTIQGVVLDGLGNSPGSDAGNVTVHITHPDATGSIMTRTTTPSASGVYSFSNQIPIGNHLVQAIHNTNSDTTAQYVSVLPNSVITVNLRLPGNLWSTAGGGLMLVNGSLTTSHNGRDVYFSVENISGGDISITSINIEYATTAWYEQILIGEMLVFNDKNPRGASGDTHTFSIVTIERGSQETIQMRRFKDAQSGPAGDVDMRGTAFTVVFSEGSIVTFVAGTDD